MTGLECFQLYGSCIGTCQAATTVYYDDDGSNMIFEWAVAAGNPVIDEHNLVVCSGSENACGAEDDWIVRIDSTTPGTPSFCWDGYPDLDESDHPDQTIYWGGVCNCVSGVTYTLKRRINHSGRWVLVDENIDATQYHDGNFLCSPGDFIEYGVYGTNAAGTEGSWQFSDGFIFTGRRLDAPGYLWEGNGDSDGNTEDVDFDPDGKVLLNWAYNQDADTPVVFRLEKSIEFGAWTLVAQNLTTLTYTDEDTTDSYKDKDLIQYRIRAENPYSKEQFSDWVCSDGFFLTDELIEYQMIIILSPIYSYLYQQPGHPLRLAIENYKLNVWLHLGWNIDVVCLEGGSNDKEFIKNNIIFIYYYVFHEKGFYAALAVGDDLEIYRKLKGESYKIGNQTFWRCFCQPDNQEWEDQVDDDLGEDCYFPEVFVSLLIPYGENTYDKAQKLANTFNKFAEHQDLNKMEEYGDYLQIFIQLDAGMKIDSSYGCFEEPWFSPAGITADSFWFGQLECQGPNCNYEFEKWINPPGDIVEDAVENGIWRALIAMGHGDSGGINLQQPDERYCTEPECTFGCKGNEEPRCCHMHDSRGINAGDLDNINSAFFVGSCCFASTWIIASGLNFNCEYGGYNGPYKPISDNWIGHSVIDNQNHLRPLC